MNKPNKISLVVALSMALMPFLGQGCVRKQGIGSTGGTVAITGIVPVIDMPSKPVLESLDSDELVAYNALPESARKKLQGNDKKLKMYAAQLQVAIEDYNTYAAVRNKTSNDAVGVKMGVK